MPPQRENLPVRASRSTPSKFVLFIVLLPFVYDPVSALPEAIFLNKLVFLPCFYHLMISSSDLEIDPFGFMSIIKGYKVYKALIGMTWLTSGWYSIY